MQFNFARNFAGKALAIIALGAVLAGCTTPLPKDLVTPEFSGKAPAAINVGMTDHRTFILSGEKEEWFEGIFRDGYGIARSLERPGPLEGEPFAIYLSTMLADGLEANGANASVVSVPKGADLDTAVSAVANGAPGIVFKIVHSRYNFGWGNREYRHHFDVVVADGSGQVVLKKTFERFDAELPANYEHTVYGFYALTYKRILEGILRDPDVAKALSSL